MEGGGWDEDFFDVIVDDLEGIVPCIVDVEANESREMLKLEPDEEDV